MPRREEHNGFGAGFYCTQCPSDTAYVDYSNDEDGLLEGLLLTCTLCGHVWVEQVGGGRGRGHQKRITD